MAWTQDTSEILSARARSRRLAAATVALCSIVMIGLAARLARADEPAAPDFALKSSTGVNLRLSEYRSEVVALAFVASWCGACRDGMPQLRRLQQELAADGLRVLVVDFDTRPEVPPRSPPPPPAPSRCCSTPRARPAGSMTSAGCPPSSWWTAAASCAASIATGSWLPRRS